MVILGYVWFTGHRGYIEGVQGPDRDVWGLGILPQ